MAKISKIKVANNTLDIADVPLTLDNGSIITHGYYSLTSKERTCTVLETTDDEIDFRGGTANPGYEHYLLVKNIGAVPLIIHLPTGCVCSDNRFEIEVGSFIEFSYIYTGAYLVVTASPELTVAS